MGDPVTINLQHVARGLGLPLGQVQAVVELLDEGNTVPFITRYRKDQTGGLDEEQIRQIQDRLTKNRLLAERKQTILRSIESQGKLTEKLSKQIRAAGTTKRLEDLYLPFRPKKQTLATVARSRGLEPLAAEILAAEPGSSDLDSRAADFANADRQVPTAADALLGAGHILAEQFSERADLRQRLRDIIHRSGKLLSTRIAGESRASADKTRESPKAAAAATRAEPAAEEPPTPRSAAPGEETSKADPPQTGPSETGESSNPPPAGLEPPEETDPESREPAAGSAAEDQPTEAQPAEQPPAEARPSTEPQAEAERPVDCTPQSEPSGEAEAALPPPEQPEGEPPSPSEVEEEPEGGPKVEGDPSPEAEATVGDSGEAAVKTPPDDGAESEAKGPSAQPEASAAGQSAAATKPRVKPTRRAERKLSKKELKKKKAEERLQKAFSDYFDYGEEIKKIPPHRVLAINRGERAKVLRVKLEVDVEPLERALDEVCVPENHPHAEFLRGCARDALSRLILPSLEREIRRELTDRAETHAVGVFARNLRNLLLQPPVHGCRVLAVDPGYRSGCKLAALDQFGNVLGHAVIFLVGKPDRKQEARQTVVDLIERFQLTVATIGNGTACREAENFFSDLVADEVRAKSVSYVIVNEAGASVYSTSRLGREEFPHYDASLRGSISIGRRLQDPLSELVKIDPANIGVGLYQHDVKAKHLKTSLDDVVESCVNYVGVDVNTASPALLRYVSGLNQLTARRVYEHRRQHGPFRSREQLREVPSFGEATFVQAAGFLKITTGENPLDATWIHPESYEIASRVMENLDSAPADLATKDVAESLAARIGQVDVPALAKELEVGELLLKDILAQLARPGRDPRDDLPGPVFKQGVLKLEGLQPGMELTGTVLNVVDFGAFVDIGMHDSGLVHVSQLADRFVRDPHDVIAVGDIVKVWVMDVDKERRRVSLTMIAPHAKRSAPRRDAKPPARRPSGDRPERPRGEPRGKPKGPPRGRPQGPPKPRFKPRRKPKPVIPITDEMKTGKEPMRSFSDLIQFYQTKEEDDPTQRRKKSRAKGPDDKASTRKDEPKTEKPEPDAPQDQPAATPDVAQTPRETQAPEPHSQDLAEPTQAAEGTAEAPREETRPARDEPPVAPPEAPSPQNEPEDVPSGPQAADASPESAGAERHTPADDASATTPDAPANGDQSRDS
ncbi:MAG: Tex-like N-terminal domain-containing protein [Planctomycetota bacterium]|jgi:uncharacterized protein